MSKRTMHLRPKTPLTSPLILIAMIASFGDITAQVTERAPTKSKRQDVRSPFKRAFENAAKDTETRKRPFLDLDSELQSLEAAIEPDSYIVGPGDVFQISVWSNTELTFNIPITPDGSLTIPTIGMLAVDGKTLAAVQSIVREAGAKKYLQTQVTAQLVRLRKFRVHVTGQIMNPGLYEALAIDRVSDIIEEAGGLTNWGSERAIQVRHLDGTVDTSDLFSYEKLGRLESNIVLRGGDLVHVPSIAFTDATVKVEGQVNSPGIYQLAQNETLEDLLLRADAFNKRADLTAAYVERKAGANDASETIPIFPYLQSQGNGHSDLFLQDGDVIMIPARYEDVYVVGAVKNPGPYAYYPNMRAIDYLGLAGSSEKAKSPSKVQVIRKSSTKSVNGKNLIIEPGDTVFIPARMELGVREIASVVVTVTNVLLAMKALDLL